MLSSNEPISDDSLIVAATPAISRRQILKAGAWAAPVIVLATATPAAAGSPPPTPSVVAAVVSVAALRAQSAGKKVVVNEAQVWYNPGQWPSGSNPQHGPTTATVTWRVVLKNSSNQVVHTFAPDRTDDIGPWGNKKVNGLSTPNLPAGVYTVVCEIVTVTFAQNPLNGSNFVSITPASESLPITIS